MNAFIKRPGELPEQINVDNELHALQDAVGGQIEVVGLASDFVIICDEEGLINRKEFNCTICGIYFFGTILFVGKDGEEFTDCPISVAAMREVFPKMYCDPMRERAER